MLPNNETDDLSSNEPMNEPLCFDSGIIWFPTMVLFVRSSFDDLTLNTGPMSAALFDNVEFSNEEINQVYSSANDILQEYGVNGAKTFVEGFANSNVDFDTYSKVFNDFYVVGGNMQKSFALTKQQSLAGELSGIDNTVLKAMWTAGMLDSKGRVDKAQRKVNAIKKDQKNKTNNKK